MRHERIPPGFESNDSSTSDPSSAQRCIAAFEAELDYVFASLRRLGADPDQVEDLAQQVFLILLRTWRTAERRPSLRPYLFGLAVRVIVRQRSRAGETSTDSPRPRPLSLAALDRVPLKSRAVLLLHDLDHVPLSEIAGSLSMSRLGVAVRLRKARAELEAAIRHLAADWQAGRFGRPDLLLKALGIGAPGPANAGPPSEGPAGGGPGSDGEGEHAGDVVREILNLQDEIFLLEMVMDDLPDTIYFKDRDSRFTRINRYAAMHYGIVNPALAVGRTDFDFFTDEHAGQALRDEQEIIRTGRPLVSVEERETLPDGNLRWVWTTKLPLRDRDGEIVGTFGLSRDLAGVKAIR